MTSNRNIIFWRDNLSAFYLLGNGDPPGPFKDPHWITELKTGSMFLGITSTKELTLNDPCLGFI